MTTNSAHQLVSSHTNLLFSKAQTTERRERWPALRDRKSDYALSGAIDISRMLRSGKAVGVGTGYRTRCQRLFLKGDWLQSLKREKVRWSPDLLTCFGPNYLAEASMTSSVGWRFWAISSFSSLLWRNS